jgi:cytoskeletal protein CcmA (bactofilin family)
MRFARYLILLVLLLLTGGVVAEVLQQDNCFIASDEVIDGNLYVLCRSLVIDGQVNGNLIGAAFTARINGTVQKNIYLLGGEAEMAGALGRDLHFAGLSLDVKPETRFENGDIFSLALSAIVQPETSLPGGIVSIGYQLIVNGVVQQEINFWGSALQIEGVVEGDVEASVGNAESQEAASQLETLLLPLQFEVDFINPGLVLTESGKIDGLLTYRGAAPGRLDGRLSQNAQYIPEITNDRLIDLVEQNDGLTAFGFYLSQVVREFTTLGLVGLMGLVVIPEIVKRPIRTVRRQPLTSLGVGLLTFILSFPVVLIIFFLSLIVILILALLRLDGVLAASGILLGIVNIGGTSLFYFIAIFVSRMIMAVALGRLVVSQFIPINTAKSWFISLGVGVALLAFIASLPVVGWVFNALALFLGLGAMLTVIQGELRAMRDDVLNAAPVYYSDSPMMVTMPPPMLEERASSPGLENLPEGFSLEWFNQD